MNEEKILRSEDQELRDAGFLVLARLPEEVLVEALEKVMPGSSLMEDQELLDRFLAVPEDVAFRALDRIITFAVSRVTVKTADLTRIDTSEISVSRVTPEFASDSVFGLFSSRVLELANQAFSAMYARIFKQYWHNSMDARMARNYCITKWGEGIYEVYLPTFARIDGGNLGYCRIIIKILPEIDRQAAHEQTIECFEQHVKPAGEIDSEFISLVAPRRSEKARRERQFIWGFKHEKKPGYLTAVVINPVPEICMKRVLTVLTKFLKTRIGKLLEALNLEPWEYDYKEHEQLYYSKLPDIIESFSYLLASSFRCLSHSLNWLLMKTRGLLQEIGRQNVLKMAISKFSELKTILRGVRIENPQILGELEAVLVKATSSRFAETFVKKQGKFRPSTAEESGQPREDPSTFLERLRHAEPLDELPDRGKVRWSNG